MPTSTNSEAVMAEVIKVLTDPTVQPAAKAATVLGGAAVSKATATTAEAAAVIAAADVLTWLGIAYTVILIAIATPKLYRSVRWWFGQDRRCPEFLDDHKAPRRRATDTKESDDEH